MTADTHNPDRNATASAIYYIANNMKIDDLVHTMLHTCTTVEEYTEKLNGLLRLFWGESTPEGKKLNDVTWIEVIVHILPVECLIPIFKLSMLKAKGKETNNEETEEQCGR